MAVLRQSSQLGSVMGIEGGARKRVHRLQLERLGRQPSALSPLRYPGSKRQLIPLFEKLITANSPVPQLFVEPFAGGASVGLHLIADGWVDRLLLADSDPLLASFWEVACFDPHWLVDAMWDTPVTVAKWSHFRDNPVRSKRDRALACLFLNRTSFSGILHEQAGPLGGWDQASDYKIDCRFPKNTLEQRILHIGKLADNGFIEDVWHADYRDTIGLVRRRQGYKENRIWLYLDPPFYAKSQKLYRDSFSENDHQTLARLVTRLSGRWVLSYDFHPEIEELYLQESATSHEVKVVECLYKASAPSKRADELIISSLPRISGGAR